MAAARGWRTDGEVEAYVDAPPEEVYRVVADVTTVGRRSSECYAARWLPGAEPGTVGARFRGWNRSGWARWSRTCEVLEADPGRSFVFRTLPERFDPRRIDSTTWSYTFTAEGSGTRVRHAYRVTRLPLAPFRVVIARVMPHHLDMRPHMAATLDALETTVAR